MSAGIRSIALLLSLVGPAGAQVEYELTYEVFWSPAHVASGSLPAGAHITDVIGATHSGNPLWTPGRLASGAMELVAETGSTFQMEQRIQSRIENGTAGVQIDLPSVFSFPSVTTIPLEVDPAFPLVSLAAMIAPSPDWFIGLSAVDLAPGGIFVDELVVELRPWDAGTEEGSEFSLLNQETVPAEPISAIDGPPFVGSPAIGRITFRLVERVPAMGLAPSAVGALALLVAARGRRLGLRSQPRGPEGGGGNGRSFSTRRVVARQSVGPILNLSVSFQIREDQADVQELTAPDVPAPDSLAPDDWGPILERRPVACEGARSACWLRVAGPLADDPVTRSCALAYASDDIPTEAASRSQLRTGTLEDEPASRA